MNLCTSAVQFFLLASTTAAHTASAFVAPSVTLTKSASRHKASSVAFTPAARPSALKVTKNLFDDLAGAVEGFENGGDDDDHGNSIKLLQGIVAVLTSLDKPESTFLTDESLVEEPISRKFISMASSAAKISTRDIAEYKEMEDPKSKFSGVVDLLTDLIDDFISLKETGKLYNGKMSYSTYPRHPEFPDVDLSWMMKQLDGPPPLEYIFSIHKIKRMIKRFLAFEVGQKLTERRANRTSGEKMFKAFFTNFSDLVRKPRLLIKTWENDTELARQFIAGLNPVMICVAKDVSQLSSNIVAHFGEERLQGLLNEKRLFFVSYDALADLKVNPHQAHPAAYNPDHPQDDPRYFYAPIVVFELDEERKELDIMGIQLERTDDAKIYTSEDNENEWLMAKCHLASSDANMHEWVNHLGKTHLTMEPHILAIHNTLKYKKHKLATFFEPLIKDTLLLNYAARASLGSFEASAWGDKHSSIGVGQYMQINCNWWKTYNFFESSGLPQELASRGFDKDFDMPSYLFREDGLKLWDAYGSFASDFVDEHYPTDAHVSNDKVVQEWAIETTAFDKGAVPGFPASIRDKTTLVKIMQTLMWIPSGLHAAMNFPQYDYYAFAPNKPLYMREPLSGTDRKGIFDNSLPTKKYVSDDPDDISMHEMVNMLTLPSETCIDNLSGNFADVGEKSYAKFQKKLDEISDAIEERNGKNQSDGKPVYSYLNPTVVPASIDI